MLAPYYQDPEFAALPRAQRERVSIVVTTILNTQGKGKSKPGGLLSRIARTAGCSTKSAERMYYAYRSSGDWRALCDKRSLAPVKLDNTGTKSPRFREWVKSMIESNQRSTQQAILAIRDAIKYGYDPIPGLEDWPLASGRLPAGVSETTLRSIIKRHELAPMRYGLKSAEARAHDPMVLRTRVGVPVGSVYELDDMWHDNLVVSGKEAVRVLEFGAIDYASAARIHWGNTPHVLKDDGKRQGLTQEMFVLFVAYILRYVGFAKSGLDLHMERGTATLPESVKQLITTSGMGIRIIQGRATGHTQKHLGGYEGQIGGNPRAKALIENSHSLIHNFYANLPGQVGKDRQHTQESTQGRIKAQQQVEKIREELAIAGRQDLAMGLQNHLLTKAQFDDLLIIGYKLINARTDHELEGWEPYTEAAVELAPSVWQPLSALSMTPLLQEQIATGNIRTRELRLSPAQVWEGRRPEWATIPMSLYLDIIATTKLCARKITVKAHMLMVQDKLVGQDKLIYDAAAAMAPDGTLCTLQEGTQYDCIFNPYALQALLITDERGRVIAEAPQLQRVRANDHEALHEAQHRVQQQKAAALDRQSIRQAAAVNRTAAIKEHNYAIAVDGGVATPLQQPRKRLAAKSAKPKKAKLAKPLQDDLADIFATPLPSKTKTKIEL